MLDVAEKDLAHAFLIARRPCKERERAHDLQSDLPLVAVRERADQDLFVRLDPLGLFMREFVQQIDGAHRNQPVFVLRESRDIGHQRWLRAHHREHAARLRLRSAIAAGQQPLERGSLPGSRDFGGSTFSHRN